MMNIIAWKQIETDKLGYCLVKERIISETVFHHAKRIHIYLYIHWHPNRKCYYSYAKSLGLVSFS